MRSGEEPHLPMSFCFPYPPTAMDSPNNYDKAAVSTTEDSENRGPLDTPLNRSLSTRTFCVVALILTWLAGIGILVLGVVVAKHPSTTCYKLYGYFGGSELICSSGGPYQTRLPGNKNFYYILPLLINFIITALVDGTGFIHSQTLKWAMHQEGRLSFNSNLRLFTQSRKSFSNSWFANVLIIIATTIAFASPLSSSSVRLLKPAYTPPQVLRKLGTGM
jgi:hypothetical protein